MKMCFTSATKNSRLWFNIGIALFILCIYHLIRNNFIRGKTKAAVSVSEQDKMYIQNVPLKEKDHEHVSTPVAVSYHDKLLMYDKLNETDHGNTAGARFVAIQEEGENGQADKESSTENSNSISSTDVVHHGRLQKLNRNTPVDIIDIMGQHLIKFDPAYRNPCFIGDGTNPLFKDGQLHCLPYFYLIGVKKSGTSDLFQRISAHPEFRDPGFKEAQWFPRIRCGIDTTAIKKRKPFIDSVRKGIDNRSIKFYISMFDDAAASIRKCLPDDGSKYHNCVTAEATPANLHMHTGWDMLPGNEGLTEPRYTNFHYIKHITPDAKILIIFRDPVTRLFSDFLHEMRMRKARHTPATTMAQMFHKQTSRLINEYEACFNRFSIRRCIYNETLSEQLQRGGGILTDSFRAGFYAFYMQELLSVFRREQILTIHMTHYLTKTEQTLKDTFKYLNMSPLSSIEMSNVLKLKAANTAKFNVTMYPETKQMLYKFYKPYNENMASLMEDNTYLFKQS